VHFSLSHSGGTGLVAIASTPVGVDLEELASGTTVAVLSPRLHPAERAELSLLPESERPRTFTRVWCRKEAYLKGIGTGLSRPLSADYVGAAELPSAPRGWQITDVPLDTGHLAALAVLTPGHRSAAPPAPARSSSSPGVRSSAT
jgi:4'-phosphopantetheinyl transferase